MTQTNILTDKDISTLLFGGQSEQAKLFIQFNKDKYVIVSKKGTDGYYFNEETKLWTELAFAKLLTDVIDFLHEKTDKLIGNLKKKIENSDDDDDTANWKKKVSQLEKLRLANAKASHGKAIIEFITIAFFQEDFMDKINVNESVLPIRDGRVLELKSKTVRERVREDFFTYELDVDYVSKKHQTNAFKFFNQLCCDDEKKLKVFQKMLGYSITGNIDAKCYFVLIGCGDNGKSALMDTIKKIFKSLFVAVQKSILFSENRMKSDQMPYLACLAGMRFGVYNEPSDCLEMNESMIKAITGGDQIIAKKLYRDPFEFTPVVKMWIMTNKIIKFDSCSEPMVKRTKIISMDAQFLDKPNSEIKGQYKKDPEFVRQLQNEFRDEFFSFIADGAYGYYKYKKFGDEECSSIVEHKQSYLSTIDITRNFLEEHCEIAPEHKIKTTDLFNAFLEYCKAHDLTMINREKFYESLRSKKIVTKKINGTHYYSIKILQEDIYEEQKSALDSVDEVEILPIVAKKEIAISPKLSPVSPTSCEEEEIIEIIPKDKKKKKAKQHKQYDLTPDDKDETIIPVVEDCGEDFSNLVSFGN
jgi:P4 family phage/plasmid primase-like protien